MTRSLRNHRRIPSGGRRREVADGQFQLLCTPNEIGQELFIDVDATLVFRQVSLVVCLQEDLDVRVCRAEGVNECLKHGDPILGSITLMAKGREGKAVRRAIGQVN
jgi:hypothetical protein